MRRVFLGDGSQTNWTVHRLHFPSYVAVADFLHASSYVFDASQIVDVPIEASGSKVQYWLREVRQGRVDNLLSALPEWESRHPLPEGQPLNSLPETDPRAIAHRCETYFENNRDRMNYPEYRKQGLPITLSLLESAIKEINYRMKGTEKSWNRTSEAATSSRTSLPVRGQESTRPKFNVESMLQVRVSLLCDDDRLTEHILNRPGRATRHSAHALSKS